MILPHALLRVCCLREEDSLVIISKSSWASLMLASLPNQEPISSASASLVGKSIGFLGIIVSPRVGWAAFALFCSACRIAAPCIGFCLRSAVSFELYL